jgi:ribosomal protein L37AE/L43A
MISGRFGSPSTFCFSSTSSNISMHTLRSAYECASLTFRERITRLFVSIRSCIG